MKNLFYIVLSLILISCLGVSSIVYANETLNVAIMSAHGMSDSAQYVAEQFNKKYGDKIEVEVTPIGFDVLLDKMLIDFSTGSNLFDVYSVGYHWIGQVGLYLADLEKVKSEYPEIVDPNYDEEDFSKILWDTYTTWQGKQIGLPFVGGTLTLFYRTDLFENPEYKKAFKEEYGYDLKMPQLGDDPLTYQQLYDYAEFFTKGVKWSDAKQYGMALPAAAGDPLLSTFCCFFGDYRRSPEGIKELGKVDPDYGDYFTEDHKVAFDPKISDFGLKALKDYLELGKFSPAPETLDWITTSEPFSSGLSAMMIGWGGYWPSITAPSSKVHGKVGVSLIPMPHLGGWNVAINNDSDKKKWAYIYMQMLTSKDTTKILYKKFTETPTRNSTMMDNELQKDNPDLWVMAPSLERVSTRPKIPVLAKLEHSMGTILSKAWTGELSPEEALQRTADDWNRIVKMAGY